MPKYLTIDEAQQQLPKLPEQLKDEPTIITKEGKPVMITFSIEQFESLIETIKIIADKEFMQELEQGIKDAKNCEIISLESLKEELGL
jgi:antitoxin YefM